VDVVQVISAVTAVVLAAGVGGFLLARASKKTPSPSLPPAGPTLAETGTTVSIGKALIRRRFNASTSSQEVSELDRFIDRLFEVLPHLSEADPAERPVIDEIATLVEQATKEGESALPGASQMVEELIGLASPSGPTRAPQVWQGLQERLQMVRAVGTLHRSTVGGLEAAKVGDWLKIEMEPHVVRERSLYREDYNCRRYETVDLRVQSLEDGQSRSLSFEQDDGLQIYLEVERPRFADLGITKEKLARIDDEEEGGFTYGGRRYEYQDSGDSAYFAGGGNEADRLYYWEFESEQGDRWISVEQYDAVPEVTITRQIEESRIELFPVDRRARS
jgi:hypothetical protein